MDPVPTGDVLVTGGTSDGDRTNPAGAVYVAELWNPGSGAWIQLASDAVFRGYHSTSLLLPDGRVLHTGGGDGGGVPNNLNYEIYSPPYLFTGAPDRHWCNARDGRVRSVTLPASSTATPPRPYMLFLVNGNGVPSVGRIMRLQ